MEKAPGVSYLVSALYSRMESFGKLMGPLERKRGWNYQGSLNELVSERTVFVLIVVHGGQATWRRSGSRGEVFVAFQAGSDADLGPHFTGDVCRGDRRPHHAQNAPAAAHRHTFAQSNLGGHLEGEFDLGSFIERQVGEEKDATGTQVLAESCAFQCGGWLTQSDWNGIKEPLADTTFNSNWRSGHRRVPSAQVSTTAGPLL